MSAFESADHLVRYLEPLDVRPEDVVFDSLGRRYRLTVVEPTHGWRRFFQYPPPFVRVDAVEGESPDQEALRNALVEALVERGAHPEKFSPWATEGVIQEAWRQFREP